MLLLALKEAAYKIACWKYMDVVVKEESFTSAGAAANRNMNVDSDHASTRLRSTVLEGR